MNEQAKKYLADIIFSIDCISEFTNNVPNFENYQSDLKTKNAVERQLSIIGEAINRLEKVTKEISLTNARQIVGMRNRIIHAYDNVDDSIIWLIIKKYLPELKTEVEQLLSQE